MRHSLLPLLLLLTACASATAPVEEPNHVLVFLRRPSDAPQFDEAKLKELQAGHMANMRRLHEEGRLVMAGPFLDDTSLRGVFVLRTADLDEARRWVASDPSVQAGRLAGELHPFTVAPSTFGKPPSDAPMDRYSMVVLTADRAAPVRKDLWSRHRLFLDDLESRGQLAMRAEFPGADSVRALYILTSTVEEARAIAASDPYVSAGAMKSEVHPWMSQRGVLPR